MGEEGAVGAVDVDLKAVEEVEELELVGAAVDDDVAAGPSEELRSTISARKRAWRAMWRSLMAKRQGGGRCRVWRGEGVLGLGFLRSARRGRGGQIGWLGAAANR